jgi:multidrug resistance efflux pump
LELFLSNGRPFLTFAELEAERVETVAQLSQVESQLTETKSQLTETKSRLTQVESDKKRLAELTQLVLQQRASAEELIELQTLLQRSLTQSW